MQRRSKKRFIDFSPDLRGILNTCNWCCEVATPFTPRPLKRKTPLGRGDLLIYMTIEWQIERCAGFHCSPRTWKGLIQKLFTMGLLERWNRISALTSSTELCPTVWYTGIKWLKIYVTLSSSSHVLFWNVKLIMFFILLWIVAGFLSCLLCSFNANARSRDLMYCIPITMPSSSHRDELVI